MGQRRIGLCGVLCLLAGFGAAGCGGGGGAQNSGIQVSIASPSGAQTIDQAQAVNVTASVTSSIASAQSAANYTVTWTLSGVSCTGTACGSLTNETGTSVTYAAPASVQSNLVVDVMATSTADASKSASLQITVAAVAVTLEPKQTQVAAGTNLYPTGI
jgi:hypothetical protein